jgi:hypothetical protein
MCFPVQMVCFSENCQKKRIHIYGLLDIKITMHAILFYNIYVLNSEEYLCVLFLNMKFKFVTILSIPFQICRK